MQASATAPPTGQHTVENDLRDEALGYFFRPEQQASTAPTTGGVNNIVQYVNTADGHKYVLRIYNNGNKTEKVRGVCSLTAVAVQQHLQMGLLMPLRLSCCSNSSGCCSISGGYVNL
jgi:hypothetical protein